MKEPYISELKQLVAQYKYFQNQLLTLKENELEQKIELQTLEDQIEDTIEFTREKIEDKVVKKRLSR